MGGLFWCYDTEQHCNGYSCTTHLHHHHHHRSDFLLFWPSDHQEKQQTKKVKTLFKKYIHTLKETNAKRLQPVWKSCSALKVVKKKRLSGASPILCLSRRSLRQIADSRFESEGKSRGERSERRLFLFAPFSFRQPRASQAQHFSSRLAQKHQALVRWWWWLGGGAF